MDKRTLVHPDNGVISVPKGNELSSHKKTWGGRKDMGETDRILLSERSQSEKTAYCISLTI